jgi:mycothiol synthase
MAPPVTILDPKTATDEQLAPAAGRLAAATAEGTRLPARRTEHQIAWLRADDPTATCELLVAGDVADPHGVLELALDITDENPHLAFFTVAVPPDRRRMGTGRFLVEAALERAAAAGRRTAITGSDPGHLAAGPFGDAIGFEPALVMRGSALTLADVDRALVADWSRSLDDAYQVDLFIDRVPDDVIDAYMVATQAMNDAPRDDLDMADEAPDPNRLRYWEELTRVCGGRRISALARHRDTGEAAGFSNLWWEPELHTVVSQGGTGVVAAHRGHGLGRVLKARVLERLAEMFPEATEIRTDNAHTNPWMIKINDDLGFHPYGDLIEWQRKV